MVNAEELTRLLKKALAARRPLIDEGSDNGRYGGACRLFNGHLEGCPELVIDLYESTLLFHACDAAASIAPLIDAAKEFLLARLTWVKAIVLKDRKATDTAAQRGCLIHDRAMPDDRVREYGVWYALDLLMNQDASFYLDTRNLRHWLLEQMAGKSVLNTFAYTGSLGIAAQAAGATRVLQTDLNRRFLNVARRSCILNGFPVDKRNFQIADFWPQMSRLKRTGQRFDCIILDPPFFSETPKGTIDLARDSVRLINKVRPLVNSGGRIVTVNNALFLSGAEYMHSLESLCTDDHVEIVELIPVPDDTVGYQETRQTPPVTDPAPFNHATKIAVLRIR